MRRGHAEASQPRTYRRAFPGAADPLTPTPGGTNGDPQGTGRSSLLRGSHRGWGLGAARSSPSGAEAVAPPGRRAADGSGRTQHAEGQAGRACLHPTAACAPSARLRLPTTAGGGRPLPDRVSAGGQGGRGKWTGVRRAGSVTAHLENSSEPPPAPALSPSPSGTFWDLLGPTPPSARPPAPSSAQRP